ncbi:cadmium transporter [Enterococcus thailandicus]|uniref:Cadmium transporter n=1 Tax=Enterococcus thailandicus TaxID=417368 RepID=A0A1L8XFL9_ENTTH|nr:MULTISPECIES: cadmium resistance transporter [Enterococcus]ASZ08127.1 calcium-binding protein [Enterococcus thailandicus]MDK4353058.1 cadmium resistance transporter [Enterococcus thailandicus]MDT2735440.1 cadmium resistance transporter [Enterococcus thailandicus]MDT2753161.1 cadmium resistance transporter [Enterococcus thailandicus]MDT2776619.1 cadmium resistance transporter [Enterococcus thailandicus]
MLTTLTTSLISFISTNIDDIFILTILFSQVGKNLSKKDIVLGQYLGVGLLVLFSILASHSLNRIQTEYLGLLGIIPIFLGIKSWLDFVKNKKRTVSIEKDSSANKADLTDETLLTSGLRPHFLNVTLLTLGNGSNNIGIYVPLFSRYSVIDLIITVLIFIIMIAIWCYFSFKLANLSFIQEELHRHQVFIIPVIFIGLGIYILIDSGLFN